MPNQRFDIHPAATLFPLMTEEEYQGLKADIAENGQRECITVWKGQLIDGRNRLRACEELDRTPHVAELDEDEDPWAYVISHNLHRRHLTTSQRSAVATELAKLKRGDNQYKKEGGSKDPPSIDDAAKQMKVSRKSVVRAKQVQEHGSEAVFQAVKQGELPVSLAAELVKAVPDKKEQSKLVKQGTKAVREAVKAQESDVTHKRDGALLEKVKKIWNRCSDEEKDQIREWISEQD